ncbi:hypothetical protein [Ornithinimicrobium sp. LYQ103]|uniref:hypothetical protein n=1 Tax=Ornithinimicrobium sp. LYQ103 TaxID=3378796 RepID=UPI0038537B7F
MTEGDDFAELLSSSIGDARPGPLLLLPEGERVVVFFFPLETGFGWPPDQPVRLHERPHPSLLDAISRLTGTDREPEQYPDAVVTSSLLCHEVPSDAATAVQLTPMMHAFHRGFPHAGDPPKTPPILETATVVVEVAIPLITLLARKSVDEGLRVAELPDLQDPPPELVSDAFDAALESVRHLQRSYAAITRRPTKLLSRQQLPPVTVYGVRNMNALEPGATTGGVFLTNNRLERLAPMEPLPPERRRLMLDAPEVGLHAIPYIDLYNQADVALHIDGTLRECAVMLGAASEVFLSRLILTMRWERGWTPENSARDWPDSLLARVRRELPEQVGGSWSMDTGEEAPRRWYRDVYGLRNRVAHAGYEPSFDECVTAQGALNELISWVGNRLCSGQRLKKFPRTASLFYRERLEARIDRLPWLKDLWHDHNEVPWSMTSSAWIETHDRLVRDEVAPRSPNASRAELASLWIRGTTQPRSWILTDPVTELACEAEVDQAVVKIQTDRTFTNHIPEGVVYVGAHARLEGDVLSHGPWIEAYHVNPALVVMVDHSDLDQPWRVTPVA